MTKTLSQLKKDITIGRFIIMEQLQEGKYINDEQYTPFEVVPIPEKLQGVRIVARIGIIKLKKTKRMTTKQLIDQLIKKGETCIYNTETYQITTAAELLSQFYAHTFTPDEAHTFIAERHTTYRRKAFISHLKAHAQHNKAITV